MSDYQLSMQKGRGSGAPKIDMPDAPPAWASQEQSAQAPVAAELPPAPEMWQQEVSEVPAQGETVNEPVQTAEAALVDPAPAPAPEESPRPAKAAKPLEENIRWLRESKERAERERDEALKLMQQLAAQKQAAQEDDIPDEALGEGDLVEGKHLSAVRKEVKNLKEQLKKQYTEASTMAAEAKLRAQYPDFDTVVNSDNLDTFRETYPEIASTLNANTDLYSKAVAAYTMIKQFGIAKPAQPTYDADRARAQKNLAKPRPLTSIGAQQGESPMSRANAFANGLTDDVKQQLYKEMMAFRNN
jgi:hypothetical protein